MCLIFIDIMTHPRHKICLSIVNKKLQLNLTQNSFKCHLSVIRREGEGGRESVGGLLYYAAQDNLTIRLGGFAIMTQETRMLW